MPTAQTIRAIRMRWALLRARSAARAGDWDGAAAALRTTGRPRSVRRVRAVSSPSGAGAVGSEAYLAAIALTTRSGCGASGSRAWLGATGDTDGLAHVTTTMRERDRCLSPVEQRLLAADPEHFEARRYLVAFVTAHLDEMVSVQ